MQAQQFNFITKSGGHTQTGTHTTAGAIASASVSVWVAAWVCECVGVHLASCSVDKVHLPFGVYLNAPSLSGCLVPSPSCSGKSVIVYLMLYICTQIHTCTGRESI